MYLFFLLESQSPLTPSSNLALIINGATLWRKPVVGLCTGHSVNFQQKLIRITSELIQLECARASAKAIRKDQCGVIYPMGSKHQARWMSALHSYRFFLLSTCMI